MSARVRTISSDGPFRLRYLARLVSRMYIYMCALFGYCPFAPAPLRDILLYVGGLVATMRVPSERSVMACSVGCVGVPPCRLVQLLLAGMLVPERVGNTLRVGTWCVPPPWQSFARGRLYHVVPAVIRRHDRKRSKKSRPPHQTRIGSSASVLFRPWSILSPCSGHTHSCVHMHSAGRPRGTHRGARACPRYRALVVRHIFRSSASA